MVAAQSSICRSSEFKNILPAAYGIFVTSILQIIHYFLLYFATAMHFSPTKNIINRLLALHLVILFAIGNTPKQFLHDAFAVHIDNSHLCDMAGKHQDCMHKASYTCQLEHPVINTDYTSTIYIPAFTCLPLFTTDYSILNTWFSTSVDGLKESRGPPSRA